MQLSLVQRIILFIIPLVFAVTLHEVAHGCVANMLGDDTAKVQGRLTINPLKHIDPLGTIIIPGMLLLLSGIAFGYAKPVPVTWQKLRHMPRDMALVALAGPGANLLMALLWAVLVKLTLPITLAGSYFSFVMTNMAIMGMQINVALLILNLIPIPPLDGSRVVLSFLRGQAARFYVRIEPYGFFILLALLFLGLLSKLITPFFIYLLHLIDQLIGISLP